MIRSYRRLRAWMKGSRKRKAVVFGPLALLLIAGTAVAFFVLKGGGTGSGTQNFGTATASQPLAVHLSWPDGLAPGSPANGEPISVTVDNPNGGAAVFVDRFAITGISSTNAACETNEIQTGNVYVHDYNSGQNVGYGASQLAPGTDNSSDFGPLQPGYNVPPKATGFVIDLTGTTGGSNNAPPPAVVMTDSGAAQDCTGAPLTVTATLDHRGP